MSTITSARRLGFAAALVLGSVGASAAPREIPLPGDRAFPESITSTGDGTLYVGGLATGGVLRARAGSAQAEPWIKPGAYDTRSVFGVLADEKSRTLWVCSNDVSSLGVPGPTSVEGGFLKGFDLDTGEGKISARLPGAHALCNDMAIAPDGAVLVTNSLAPQILRLAPGGKQLDVWLSDPAFTPPKGGVGLDGIAFGGDGNLYVDTFDKAELFRIDVKDGKAARVTKLQASRPLALADALRPAEGGSFLMIEGAGRLDRATVSGDRVSIETLKDGFAQPTGVTWVGTTAWVAEGQLSHLFNPKSGPAKLPFRIYAVPLSGPEPAQP